MLKISIAIPVHNEQDGIEDLINSVVDQDALDICEVIFIASGCTDDSAKIIRRYLKLNPHFALIEEKKRKGKAAALNLFLSEAKGDICIVLNSDIVLSRHCLSFLTVPFSRKEVGMTGAHAVPLCHKRRFVTLLNKILWGINNQFNKKYIKLGEAIAFRNILKKIPYDTAVDEASIESFFVNRGYKLYYSSNAIIYNRCPTTVKDLFFQRVRIFWGHIDTRSRSGYSVKSMNFYMAAYGVFAYIIKKPLSAPFAFFLCALELISRLSAYLMYYVCKKPPPFIWQKYEKE